MDKRIRVDRTRVEQAMMQTRVLKVIVSVVVFLVALGLLHSLILGGASPVNLSKQNSPNNVAVQSLGSSSSSSTLDSDIASALGTQYKIDSTTYFDNKNWALVKAVAINNDGEPNFIVVQKVAANYQVVVGPASDFPSSTLTSVPSDVTNYLTQQGLVSQTDQDQQQGD